MILEVRLLPGLFASFVAPHTTAHQATLIAGRPKGSLQGTIAKPDHAHMRPWEAPDQWPHCAFRVSKLFKPSVLVVLKASGPMRVCARLMAASEALQAACKSYNYH